MSGAVFVAVVAVVAVALVGGYVWGWFTGSARAEHAPQTCRDKLKAAERAAAIWQGRAGQLEVEVKALRRDQAEHAAAETATVKMLLGEIEKATKVTPSLDVALRRDLAGATTS